MVLLARAKAKEVRNRLYLNRRMLLARNTLLLHRVTNNCVGTSRPLPLTLPGWETQKERALQHWNGLNRSVIGNRMATKMRFD
jgi:hypothetical protein